MMQLIYTIKFNYSVRLTCVGANKIRQLSNVKASQLSRNLYYIINTIHFSSIWLLIDLVAAVSRYLLATLNSQSIITNHKIAPVSYLYIWKTTLKFHYAHHVRRSADWQHPVRDSFCMYLFIYLFRLKIYYSGLTYSVRLVKVRPVYKKLRLILRLRFFRRFRIKPRKYFLRYVTKRINYVKKKLGYVRFLKNKKQFMSTFWRKKHSFLYKMTFLNLRTRVRFSLKQLPVFKKLQLSVT